MADEIKEEKKEEKLSPRLADEASLEAPPPQSSFSNRREEETLSDGEIEGVSLAQKEKPVVIKKEEKQEASAPAVAESKAGEKKEEPKQEGQEKAVAGNIPASQPPSPPDGGSQPPVVATVGLPPKKKFSFKGKKGILIALIIFLSLVGIVGAVYLVQRSQNPKKKAEGSGTCVNDNECAVAYNNNPSCHKSRASIRCHPEAEKAECGMNGCELYCDSSKHLIWNSDCSECVCQDGYGWNGSECVEGNKETCEWQECKEELTHGPDGNVEGTYIFVCRHLECTCEQGVLAKRCSPANSSFIKVLPWASGKLDNLGQHPDVKNKNGYIEYEHQEVDWRCFAYQADWMDSNGENIGHHMAGPSKSWDECIASPSLTPTPTPSATPTPTPTITPTPTPSPSPTPTTIPQYQCDCAEIALFDENWQLIWRRKSGYEVTEGLISPGQTIHILVMGHEDYPISEFTKARVKINLGEWRETQEHLDPDQEEMAKLVLSQLYGTNSLYSGGFYLDYTVPEEGGEFYVKAEIYVEGSDVEGEGRWCAGPDDYTAPPPAERATLFPSITGREPIGTISPTGRTVPVNTGYELPPTGVGVTQAYE